MPGVSPATCLPLRLQVMLFLLLMRVQRNVERVYRLPVVTRFTLARACVDPDACPCETQAMCSKRRRIT